MLRRLSFSSKLILLGLACCPRAAGAGAESEPWAIYFAHEASARFPAFGYELDDSIFGTPFLLRPTNAPGKPLPTGGWERNGRGLPQATASSTAGMYAIARDSCWEEQHSRSWESPCAPAGTRTDTLVDRLCVPIVAVYDTNGVCKASIAEARAPIWSPDGRRLAFLNVHREVYRSKDRLDEYPESRVSVAVLTPDEGAYRTFPTPADAVSWFDDEWLILEIRGRRYGLNALTGEPGGFHGSALYPTSMLGLVSPDGHYIYLPGSLRVWSLFGVPRHIAGQNPDTSEDPPEGIDKELTGMIIDVLGDEPLVVAGESFWVCGEGHKHDLCLGIAWSRGVRKAGTAAPHPDSEVLVLDVHRRKILRRFAADLLAPSADGAHAAVWQDGRIEFVSL